MLDSIQPASLCVMEDKSQRQRDAGHGLTSRREQPCSYIGIYQSIPMSLGSSHQRKSGIWPSLTTHITGELKISFHSCFFCSAMFSQPWFATKEEAEWQETFKEINSLPHCSYSSLFASVLIFTQQIISLPSTSTMPKERVYLSIKIV